MPVRLMIAYDGSSTAATAVRAAGSLFPAAEALTVTVPPPVTTRPETIGVAVPTLSPALVRQTLDELDAEGRVQATATAEEGAALARTAGLEATAAVAPARAPVWGTLLELAHDRAIDVLVCGTRGRGAFARALLGSTSTSLLHHTDLPLLAVPDGAGRLDGPVVVGYDGSDAAGQAIAVAGRVLAGRTVHVVNAWESPYRHGLTARALGRGPIDDLREIVSILDRALAEHAAETTQRGVALAQAAGLEVLGETLESSDSAWRSVASAAQAHGAAVIATGTRGLGGARSVLLGSVSSGLIHNADLPTLVVPAAT